MNIRTIDIRGKAYVTVAERIRLVHDQKHNFEIVESMALQIADRWIWRAVIKIDDKQYIGTAEVKLNAPKNTPDGQAPFECAETSAIGRALGMAGFGSAESIASFDEVYRAIAREEAQEQEAPAQDVAPQSPKSKPQTRPTKPLAPQSGKLVPGQYNALKTLYLRLNQEIPPDLGEWSFEQAAATIQGLQGQLKQAS